MSRRRSSYRSLASLQRDNRACRACAEAGFPLESLPVFEGVSSQRALLVGQSPGAVEGAERRPWRGRAGRTLRQWLDLDEAAFYGAFYCCSVTRCYPGKSPGGRGDRLPTPAERALCSGWLDWELRLLGPALVVTVGGLAHVLGDGVAIPLPHPSGASGWLNDPANRRRLEHATAVVRTELARVTASAGAEPVDRTAQGRDT